MHHILERIRRFIWTPRCPSFSQYLPVFFTLFEYRTHPDLSVIQITTNLKYFRIVHNFHFGRVRLVAENPFEGQELCIAFEARYRRWREWCRRWLKQFRRWWHRYRRWRRRYRRWRERYCRWRFRIWRWFWGWKDKPGHGVRLRARDWWPDLDRDKNKIS